MATNWTVVANQDSVDQVDSKIGESSDNETKQTVFGKLWGIRNVVDWLKTNWTAAKASFLDVAISSRAPASTALSTATWTATRAAKLDNLDASISGLPQGVVKSVQRGIFEVNNVKYHDITINVVNPSKCLVIIDISSSGDAVFNAILGSLSQTSLRILGGRGISSNLILSGKYSWQVIEFY